MNLPLVHAVFSYCGRNLNSNDTLLALLQENNFYEELNELLLSLYVEYTFEPSCEPSELSCRTNSISSKLHYDPNLASNTPDTNFTITTPGIVKNTALFVNNLLYLAPETVTEALHEHHIVRSYFRCLCSPPLNVTNLRLCVMYVDIVEMCATICALLTRCILTNEKCKLMCLNTRDCLHVLVTLLNPELFNNNEAHFINLRNKLWCEIFAFISTLTHSENDQNSTNFLHGYEVMSSILLNGENNHFIKAVCLSIDSKVSPLQKNALKFIISLLSPENHSSFSVKRKQSIPLFDTEKNNSFCDESENINVQIGNKFGKSELKPNVKYFVSSEESRLRKSVPILNGRMWKDNLESKVTLGAVLCNALLQMYELQNLENGKDVKKKELVLGAMSALLFASDEAKKFALENGWLEKVLSNMKALNLELSLHSLEALRMSEKKKVSAM